MHKILRILASCLLAIPLSGQAWPTELAETRHRVEVIRAQLPAITEAAQYAAGFMTADSALRFMVPWSTSPGLGLEYWVRAGGLVDVGDAAANRKPGIALLPVRSWSEYGPMAVSTADEWTNLGRVVLVFGSKNGKPNLTVGRRLIDNGAADGSSASAPMNDVANMIALWTFQAEFVAAATRRGWDPGIYLSVLMPQATSHNANIRFRMPPMGSTVEPIAAGQLGIAYLDAVDSLLSYAASAAHQSIVQRAVDSLRASRAAGGQLFVSSCGHYLLAELPGYVQQGAPFRPVDWRWDASGKFSQAGASAKDAVLWFGYGGYDCPNVEVATLFAATKLKVVVVTDKPEGAAGHSNVMATIPLSWRAPDAVVKIPYFPGAMGPVSSVEMAVHWLWMHRLTGDR